jgi:DNA-directed RNA polymerase subunit RPC12/RpoP
MEFEEIICPNCGSTISQEGLAKALKCSTCKANFHQQKYVGFLEYLMMNGFIQELDFFDKTVYGDEINHTSETEEELRDETNPNEFEENTNKIKYMERTEDLKEVTTDEEEFRKWDGIDEDWQEFNKKNNEEDKK